MKVCGWIDFIIRITGKVKRLRVLWFVSAFFYRVGGLHIVLIKLLLSTYTSPSFHHAQHPGLDWAATFSLSLFRSLFCSSRLKWSKHVRRVTLIYVTGCLQNTDQLFLYVKVNNFIISSIRIYSANNNMRQSDVVN